MKKKILIPIMCVLVLLIGIIGYIVIKNRGTSIILDINPSIEIKLTKGNVVKKVIALNEDAKEIISNDFKGKNLYETLDIITEEVIDKGYVKDNNVTVLLYSNKNVDEVKNHIAGNFGDKNISANITLVESISVEDRLLAMRYDISPSKAAFINSIKEENNIDVEELIERPTEELIETKETGYYCESGYTLHGDYCHKELKRISAKEGIICPNGYYDYNGTCYEDAPIKEKDNYVCDEYHTLQGNKCYMKEVGEKHPIYKCEKGEPPKEGEILKRGVSNNICVDRTNAKAPTLRCMIGPHIVMGGRCYVGPAPVINGGCPNGDKLVNGGCYSLDPEDQWQCPDGNIYMRSKGENIELCPDTYTYIEPSITGYTCDEGFTLVNNECIREELIEARHERYCDSGYSIIEDSKCINFNNKTSKQNGYYCENDRYVVEGNMCVLTDVVPAKHN